MTNISNAYAPFFKNWAKALGSKPTDAQLSAVHGLGCRPGKQALAIAMALRDTGVSNSQIIQATGNPQLNKMRGLITDAYLKRDMSAPPNDAGHTVYKLAVTKKGEQRIERATKAAAALEAAGAAVDAKPAKVKAAAKRTSKPRKPTADKLPKVSPVDENTGEPAAAHNEPDLTGEADNAAQATV